MGRVVTPILSPMGIRQDNWPATVGLVTGILAKEVVVATLNTLYSQEAHLSVSDTESGTILQNLKQGVFSIQKNLMALPSSLTNPLTASAPEQMMNNSVYGVMYEKFSGQVAAFAYLLFVLLYFPCISATAAMTKELNKKWTIFSVAWSTGLAYAAATCFYQVATFTSHPKKSFIWLTAILMFFVFTLSLMKRKSKLRTTPAQINDLANTRILG
jgi:ferrous iron transport protein B